MSARSFALLAIGALSGVLLSGCVFRSSQVESVQRLLPVDSVDPRLGAYAWTLSFSGLSYTLYPVEAAGRRVTFANGYGLRLQWDGETIIVIDGVPGAFGRYEAGVEGAERWYAPAGAPAVRARCTPARNWRLGDSRLGWRQECANADADRVLRSTHVVEFDGSGNIVLIEASMRPGGPTMTLRFAGRP